MFLKMVKIVTMNVRGLHDNRKRKEIFMYVNKMGFDLVFLQETHSTRNDENIWRNELGGPIEFAHGEYNARGVAILFHPRLDVRIDKVTRNKNGRFLIVDCTISEKKTGVSQHICSE